MFDLPPAAQYTQQTQISKKCTWLFFRRISFPFTICFLNDKNRIPLFILQLFQAVNFVRLGTVKLFNGKNTLSDKKIIFIYCKKTLKELMIIVAKLEALQELLVRIHYHYLSTFYISIFPFLAMKRHVMIIAQVNLFYTL